MKGNIFLAFGVLCGLGGALYGILGQDDRHLPDYAVARVNDSYITRAVYERAVNALETDKRNPLTEEDRLHVLNRLIDEELLIQYGIRQGLVRSDRQVKATLVQSVIRAKSLQAEAREISEAQARAFFVDNQPLFSRTDRLRIALIRVPQTDTRTRDQAKALAREAADRLVAGAPFARVREEYHEGGVLNLPDTPLPYGKLVDYLGPSLADQAFALESGQVAEPIFIGQAWQVLYAHERIQAPPPEFETVRDIVMAEMRRRAAEDIVRSSLAEMRRNESIHIAEDLP